KGANLEDAARAFQKILELDTDNTAMQGKLADLFMKLGRKEDARNIYLTAAQSLYQKGALDAAEEALKKVIHLDPKNEEAHLLRGKIASDSGDSAKAVANLEKLPDLETRPDALRALMMAHACVQCGQLEKAADIYKELSELEPENPLHMQNYKQVQGKLGKDPTVREISREAGMQALMVDELEHQAPVVQQDYPDPIRNAVKAAVTEAELFESYNMPMKAIAPLEAVLPQAPQDIQVNQRLASLYARS